MGEVPDWYSFILAAKWLGVPPWELFDRPDRLHWITWATIGASAEAEAQKMLQDQQASYTK